MNTSTQPDVIEETITASETLMHASLGTLENSVRPKGLILTKDQIIDLHRYEKKALNLPTEISKVIAYLGYSSETIAGPGLAPADFARCFTVVRNHALRWNPLQQRVKNVSGELKVFAAQMLTYGDSIQSVISDIKSAQTLRQLGIKTLEDLKRVQIEMGDAFPGIEFDADDADAAIDFGHLLDRIITKVADHEARTNQLKDDLASYGDDLSNEVRPAIALQLVAIENSPLKANIVRLQKEIDDLNKEIDEKSAAYKKTVMSSLESAAGLNVVGLGMAIYFGVEAEKIRKERNELKVKRDQKINEMYEMDIILGRLGYIKADLQDLEMLTIEADCATKNLITLWNKLHTYALQSREESERIDDAMRATLFVYHFEQVVAPWKLIAEEADQLLSVFAEADAEMGKDLKKSY
ncbi:alpha-xenorhabdolysin family binary toxin subunit A [Pseudomonas abietaniphila]